MLVVVLSILSILGMVSPAQEIDIIREFKLHVCAKRKTSDSSWEFLKIENEEIKAHQKILLDKKLRETSNLCVEIMNSRRGETWSRGRNSRFPFDVNLMLNLSIVVVTYFADYVHWEC